MLDLKRIHAAIIRRHDSLPATNRNLAKLLRFAAVSPSGDLNYAAALFSYHRRTVVTLNSAPNAAFFYNTLIRGYANSPSPSLALPLFVSMLRLSLPPDPFSFTFLLKAAARHRPPPSTAAAGDDSLHAPALKFGCLRCVHVHNALIHFYASRASPSDAHRAFDEMPAPDVVSWSGLLTAHLKAADPETARRVFDRMPDRDVVAWTAMISGYAHARRPREALELFRAMPVPPDEVTMVGAVSACAAASDLEAGEHMHRFIESKGFGWMVSLRNALIDMYSKCGCLVRARRVFDGTANKSVVSWNSMIAACTAHGDADGAVALFNRMVEEAKGGGGGVRPDGATILAVLTACSHVGRVEEGRVVFDKLRRGEYGEGLEVGVEHYGCVVDMLGRAGMLEEACRLIEGMHVPSNDVVWGALLGACRIHGDVVIAERALKRLMGLKPEEGEYYVLLSSIYAESGRQVEAAEVRQAMKEKGATKTPGYSTCAFTSISPC